MRGAGWGGGRGTDHTNASGGVEWGQRLRLASLPNFSGSFSFDSGSEGEVVDGTLPSHVSIKNQSVLGLLRQHPSREGRPSARGGGALPRCAQGGRSERSRGREAGRRGGRGPRSSRRLLPGEAPWPGSR